ncbi:MAG TPA: metal ABC transporter permease [Candidatus Paceibacterota bacterium]|nr:metal ABC transporter permease [Candidatus Paceibacterota bacterium]
MDLQSILIALTVGLASGAIGSFIVVRRMSLVGDALSHVALPGIALALSYGIDPFFGVIFFILAAAVIVWWLETKTALPADALVGILFTASLAVGILTIPDQEIIESLFGAFPTLPTGMLLLIIVGALGTTFLIFYLAPKFLFFTFSEELAATKGITQKYNLLLLVIFAFVVALGIKLVGTLLMGALTIIPPIIAKNLSRSMKSFIFASSLLGALIGVAGVVAADYFNLLPGPTIILFGIILFLLSLPFAKGRHYISVFR